MKQSSGVDATRAAGGPPAGQSSDCANPSAAGGSAAGGARRRMRFRQSPIYGAVVLMLNDERMTDEVGWDHCWVNGGRAPVCTHRAIRLARQWMDKVTSFCLPPNTSPAGKTPHQCWRWLSAGQTRWQALHPRQRVQCLPPCLAWVDSL